MDFHPAYPVLTRRLLLRPVTAADVEAVVAYRAIPEVCRFVPFEPMDRETVLAKLSGPWSTAAITAEGDSLLFGVELAEIGQVIGDITLFFRSAEHRTGEIGWVFHPDRSGCGYATEAAHAVLHLAFDEMQLHRVVARVDSRNDPSLRLCRRLGMREEAHLIENEWFKGAWGDEIDFAMLEAEWARQHAEGSGLPGPLFAALPRPDR